MEALIIMKKQIVAMRVIASGLLLSLFAGCGAPVADVSSPETMQPQSNETVAPPVSAPPPAAPRSAPTLKVASADANSKCRVSDQEDGTIMIVCSEKDWFMYMPATAQVECSSFGGKAKIVDGLLTIRVEALIPREGDVTNMEAELRENAVKYIKADLAEKYGENGDIKFEATKLGKSKRPALCAQTALNMNGVPGKIAACITSKKNADDEIVVHRAVWIGEDAQFDAKTTFARVKKEASSWYLYSDTDGMGKILHNW